MSHPIPQLPPCPHPIPPHQVYDLLDPSHTDPLQLHEDPVIAAACAAGQPAVAAAAIDAAVRTADVRYGTEPSMMSTGLHVLVL